MTFENSKRLYAHFISIKRFSEAEALAKKYPQLLQKEEVKEEVKEEKVVKKKPKK